MSRKKRTSKGKQSNRNRNNLDAHFIVFDYFDKPFFADQILTFCGASEKNLPYAKDHLFIVAFFFPLLMIQNMVNGLIRCDGSPIYAMVTTGIGAIINIIFDPVFIYAFDWGGLKEPL